MPWVTRETRSRRSRVRRTLRRWAFDHSGMLVELGIGAGVSAVVLFAAFRLLPV